MSAVDGIDEFAAQLAGVLKEKNAAYGDSFARVPTILAMLYPSVPPEVLENILFTARIQDKLGRIAKDPLAAGEDAYLDVAGYAMMMANWQRLKREAKALTEDTSVDALKLSSKEAAEVVAQKVDPETGKWPGGTVRPPEPKAVRDETFEEAAARLTPALRESFKALLVALRKASSCE